MPIDLRHRTVALLAVGLLMAACSSVRAPVERRTEEAAPRPAAAPPPASTAPIAPVAPTAPLPPVTPGPERAEMPVETGIASWYGQPFHGRRTANGEIYDMHALTAAHRTMPLPSYASVRNAANGREVIVRVNDRGPFTPGRIIDLSRAAARQLGISGLAAVEVTRLTAEQVGRAR